MSERQRLITRYVQRLYPEIATYYRLHFLRGEKDDSAIHMLNEALTTKYQETQNQILGELIREIPQNRGYDKVKFGQHYSKKKKNSHTEEDEEILIQAARNQPSSDEHQRAIQLFHQYEFEDSLKLFDKIRNSNRNQNGNKFYNQRIIGHIILQNYKQALLIAQKAKIPDMIFVTAISSGDFDTAKKYIDHIISAAIINTQEGYAVASNYEMIHLILYILFATSTAKETYEKTFELFRSTNWSIEELKSITHSFCENNYASFMSQFPFLENSFSISIYTSPVKAQLKQAIIQNVLVLMLYPLAKANFQVIHDTLRISDKDTIYYIKKSIREGKLNGKLDLVSMEYVASTVFDTNNREMIQIVEDSISIRQEFELNNWVHEYNSTNAPSNKKK